MARKTVKKNKEFKAKVNIEFIGEAVVRPATENDFCDDYPAKFSYIKADNGETVVYKEYEKDGFKVEKKVIFNRGGTYYIEKREKVKR